MSILVNEDYFPLIIEDYEGTTTDDEAVWHRKFIAELLARKQRYAILYNFRNLIAESQEQRKIDAEFIKENKESLRQYSIGVVFVVSSPLLRIALNAVLFLAPLPMPYTTTKTISEAVRWLERRFEEEQMVFPAAARPYLADLEIRSATKRA